MFARLPSLGDGLWYDELAAWADYAARGPVHVLTTYDDPANHVLQSLLTWASFEGLAGLAGLFAPALAMRLPSLLASLLAIGLVARLARATHAGREASRRIVVLAALLAAVCPVLALSGTEARGYAFMIAGAAGSTAAWIAWMLAPATASSARTLALYAACMLLGAWAHPVAAVVGAGHAAAALGLAVAARDRAPLRGLVPVAIAAAVTLLAYAPILGDMLRLRGTLARGGGAQPGLFGPEGVHAVLQLGGTWSTWALPGLVLLVAGVIRLVALARGGHRPAGLLLAGWLGGAAVAVILVAGLGTWVYARFLLFLVPGALVAIATALAWLLARRPLAGRLALIAIIGGWTADLITRGPRQPIREAAAVVVERAAPGDAVHAIGLRQQVSAAYLRPMPYSWSGDHGRDLADELPVPPPRWILMLYPQHVSEETIAVLRDRDYGRVARLRGWIDWGGGNVEVWERARSARDSARE